MGRRVWDCLSVFNVLYMPIYVDGSVFKTLTINFQLNDFADAGADAVVRLTQIETFSVFFDILQQQRTVR